MASLVGRKHGCKLNRVWQGMHERCTYPKHKSWAYYGGRGIAVCAEWLDFAVFKAWAMANGWRQGLKIDRIDNDGPYSPENCRIITHKENMHNARFNVWVEAWGERKLVSEWPNDPRCAVDRKTIVRRLLAGYSDQDALSLPAGAPLKQSKPLVYRRLLTAFGETKSIAEWARDARCVVPYSALLFRLDTGWDAEKALTAPSGDGKSRSSYTAFGETKSIAQWLSDPRCVVKKSTLNQRLSKLRWNPEVAITTPA